MSDITRDDLRVKCGECGGVGYPKCDCGMAHVGGHDYACASREDCACDGDGWAEVTDEEFDRLATERIQEIPARALRALLTTECETCGGSGSGPYDPVENVRYVDEPCPDCGGRGWLPNVTLDLLIDTLNDDLMLFGRGRIRDLVIDWLEAEDE